MKNRFLAITLTAVIVVSTSIPAFAAPDNSKLNESRQKYAEIETKIADVQNQIYDLDAQIEPLQVTVDKNKKEIVNINKIIDNTTKDIEQCKKEINTLDLALGQRVKAMYTSGDLEFNYLNFILESDSTSDFFSRAQAVGKIVGKDKAAIENITSKRDELNNKIQSLQDKKNEIDKLNQEVQTNLSQLDDKKKEQETLISKAKEEKSQFDSQYLSQLERETVQAQFAVIDNSNSTSSELQSAVDQLRNIRDNQIKSQIVTNEINDKIEKAKTLISQKKDAEAKAAAAATASASVSTPNRGASSRSSVKVPSAGNAQAILNEAYKHLGKPYVWGATGPDSFDCSGFTQYVFMHAAGIDISRTTYSQINVGTPVSEDQLQPGDLVFPHTGHVGIYVGNGQMIHAPQTGDVVKVSPVYKFYAARRIL
ncbi:NlpC/P60 family protein [Clostridium saccharobutylicum]|uniref:Protein P54 n=1 Tax=Clostridium saccharobutylicum DSM 13864 TaxID=1345695 RepID=U5MXI0_CLOSA|nr:C40 family peptidase [Clostridium saccharobutylicum]AGX45295.1 protein P54 [Clostridium saccharobutylicum DSM 13864]AQR92569.1 putative endopeptidase p60 precursor [Clostridium saccharobutylicum]AQS02471.1 putative endopeptidase p60 precursor [Clostridium saccharobutylicum]AQS12074.1 putative endopeptidase p60 precursor [Clostridium saccharobutylicum]AQS16454.1 putative endopeptidase p60 precursor [Clostridium saccharobutylicum]